MVVISAIQIIMVKMAKQSLRYTVNSHHLALDQLQPGCIGSFSKGWNVGKSLLQSEYIY